MKRNILLSLLCIWFCLSTQPVFAEIKVLKAETTFLKDGWYTVVRLVDTADPSEIWPAVTVEGSYGFHPFRNGSKEAVLFNKDKTICVFTLKKATQSYRIVVVKLLKSGNFLIDTDAGRKMNSILFGLGLTDIQDWADLRIDNLRGNTIYVSSNAYMYSADFKINEEGSYSLIEHSFEADPLGLSYRRMREKNKGRTNNKQ